MELFAIAKALFKPSVLIWSPDAGNTFSEVDVPLKITSWSPANEGGSVTLSPGFATVLMRVCNFVIGVPNA